MKIKEVSIKHFRSIQDVIIPFDKLTAFVGENGSGKSAVLKALNVFYSGSERITKDDFFNRDESQEIVISVTFTSLSDKAKKLFSKYLAGDELTVEKVIKSTGGAITITYHGSRPQIPQIVEVRKEDRATPMKEQYLKVLQLPEFKDLPNWKNQADALAAMDAFEAKHPELCQRVRDDGRFFGFKNVAEGYLGDFSQFLYVPAVKDAEFETDEGRGSVLVQLMDLVVRSVIQARKEVAELKEKFSKEYNEVLSPDRVTELGSLAGELTKTLQTLVPNAAVKLEWQPLPTLQIPIPKSDVSLVEDGFESPISNTGHGLQRAYIITLLQHLVLAKFRSENAKALSQEMKEVEGKESTKETEESSNVPSLVLAIEEPELYQHPNRQKHFSRILLDLSNGKIPGVADQTQIIYTTHAPLFLGISRFNQIRQTLKKDSGVNLPKHTEFKRASLDDIAAKLWAIEGASGPKYTGATLEPRLIALMTPWVNEGFFSRRIILVEGEEDRAIIEALLESRGCYPEMIGMSVIPVRGKSCLDRPYLIFSSLGIPVFIVWDGDKGKDKDVEKARCSSEENKKLLRILGKAEVEWPSAVENDYCVWESNIGSALRTTIGEDKFRSWLDAEKTAMGISRDDQALKNPDILKNIITKALGVEINFGQLGVLTDKLVAFGTQ